MESMSNSPEPEPLPVSFIVNTIDISVNAANATVKDEMDRTVEMKYITSPSPLIANGTDASEAIVVKKEEEKEKIVIYSIKKEEDDINFLADETPGVVVTKTHDSGQADTEPASAVSSPISEKVVVAKKADFVSGTALQPEEGDKSVKQEQAAGAHSTKCEGSTSSEGSSTSQTTVPVDIDGSDADDGPGDADAVQASELNAAEIDKLLLMNEEQIVTLLKQKASLFKLKQNLLINDSNKQQKREFSSKSGPPKKCVDVHVQTGTDLLLGFVTSAKVLTRMPSAIANSSVAPASNNTSTKRRAPPPPPPLKKQLEPSISTSPASRPHNPFPLTPPSLTSSAASSQGMPSRLVYNQLSQLQSPPLPQIDKGYIQQHPYPAHELYEIICNGIPIPEPFATELLPTGLRTSEVVFQPKPVPPPRPPPPPTGAAKRKVQLQLQQLRQQQQIVPYNVNLEIYQQQKTFPSSRGFGQFSENSPSTAVPITSRFLIAKKKKQPQSKVIVKKSENSNTVTFQLQEEVQQQQKEVVAQLGPVPAKGATCDRCHSQPARYLCSSCRRRWYCGTECQVADWDFHADNCN